MLSDLTRMDGITQGDCVEWRGLNCTPTVVEMINCLLYILYHNKKSNLIKEDLGGAPLGKVMEEEPVQETSGSSWRGDKWKRDDRSQWQRFQEGRYNETCWWILKGQVTSALRRVCWVWQQVVYWIQLQCSDGERSQIVQDGETNGKWGNGNPFE